MNADRMLSIKQLNALNCSHNHIFRIECSLGSIISIESAIVFGGEVEGPVVTQQRGSMKLKRSINPMGAR